MTIANSENLALVRSFQFHAVGTRRRIAQFRPFYGMSSTLGPLAVHQILSFTEQDYRRRKANLKDAARVPQVGLMARHVSPKWGLICELYFAGKDPPSVDYLRSPELLLKLKDVLDIGDMRFVFGHGKPIVFDEDIPRRLVSKVVQVSAMYATSVR